MTKRDDSRSAPLAEAVRHFLLRPDITFRLHGSFGAFQPASGEAFSQDYPGRTIAHWVDLLEHVEQRLALQSERVYAILDNLNTHHADDALLFCAQHLLWELDFQPTYAAYLNLIEPWRKVLRSLALKGRRFEILEGVGREGVGRRVPGATARRVGAAVGAVHLPMRPRGAEGWTRPL